MANVLKYLGYIYVAVIVLATMLLDFPPKDMYGYATLMTIALAVPLCGLIAYNRAMYWVSITNTYVVSAWISLTLLIYLFTKMFISSGSLIYTIFILATASMIGLLNIDKPQYRLLQLETKDVMAFVRGMFYGLIAFIFAGLILMADTSIAPMVFIGPLTSQLYQVFGLGLEFLVMLFLVAVPEELLARVLYFRFGSAVTDVYTASLITAISGYSLHAITRYSLEYGTLALFIIVVAWIIFTIAYIRHGLIASIASHATYNTLISAVIAGTQVFMTAVIIIGIIIFGVMYYKKNYVLV